MMSYILPILTIFALGAVPALVFILLLWKRSWVLIPVLLFVLLILETAAAVLLLYEGGFFGAGVLCLAVPVAASSLIVLIGARAAFFRSFKEDKLRRRWYLVGIFLIPFLLLAPLLEEFLITGVCDAWNRQTGNAIIRALDAYQQDHGTYPADLQALVPTYIPALPSPRCFAPYQWLRRLDSDLEPYEMAMTPMWSMWTEAEFELYECPAERVTLLIVPSVLFDFIERYDLTTGHWSRTSLLDGTCSFVR